MIHELMVFIENKFEREPAIELAENHDEGSVYKRWEVGPVEGMVIFIFCELKI